jgi:hypothetical protein
MSKLRRRAGSYARTSLEDIAEWLGHEPGAAPLGFCVERTLSDLSFREFVIPSGARNLLPLPAEQQIPRARSKALGMTNQGSGGQECPPHTDYRSFVTVTSS